MNFEEHNRLYPERGPEKSFAATTNLEKTLIIVVALLTAIGIGLTISIVHLKRSNSEILKNFKRIPNETDVCFTPTCVSEASNLMQSMNTSVDPCSDFYSFVCGNWIRNNYLSSSLESQFTKLTKVIVLRIKEILEELEKGKDLPPNKQKTADFYKACMDNVHRNALGAKELVSDLKEFGGWPLLEDDWNPVEFDWTHLMIGLFQKGYLSNMLFAVKVDVDVKNTSASLLGVFQPTLGLIKKEYYILPEETLLKAYKGVLFKLTKLLRPEIEARKSMEEIEEAFKLEDRIAHLMKVIDMKYPDTFYNIMSLEELENFAPKIPWKIIFTHLLPSNTTVANEERIMVTSPTFIEGLNNILEEMNTVKGRRILANYMLYRVVFNAANYLSKPYHSLVSEILAAIRHGEPSTPWEACAKLTLQLFPLPLTASYVKTYTNNKTKEVLGKMVEDVKNSLANGIKSADWLDKETKDYALVKVQKMKEAIGYRDEIMKDDNLDRYYENVNITDNHFGNIKEVIYFRLMQSMKGLHEERVRFRWFEVDNLLTANAYYRPTENTIIIPVGVLQDTVFAAGRPNYINYGSLGMIVGHELNHAFDTMGSLFDAQGSYRMWWSEKSWKTFEDKMKCYEKQYSKYYVPEVDACVNGTMTLGENVADNGGLKAAYYAYTTLLGKIGSEKSLPGLQQYSEKQMFWISYASVWCKKMTEDSMQYAMKHYVHTPSKFRVIGSLSNIKEFSEDFKCHLNTTMNPESKCTLWK